MSGVGYTPVKVFETIYSALARDLIDAPTVEEPPHQMTHLKDDPNWVTRERTNVTFYYEVPELDSTLNIDVRPNMPWAEEHFQERVSGIPYNPPPSAARWPFTQRGHKDHTDNSGKFSHTYPERMWPRRAGLMGLPSRKGGMAIIRFQMGDLESLLSVLVRNPHTRQAYLPIWFPEDLEAADLGLRVPCTLGYHFLMREGQLHMTYFIRSCDLVRFFRDDVYLAGRLLQWVIEQCTQVADRDPKEEEFWAGVVPGILTMHIVSLHCFEGDLPMLRRKYGKAVA